MIFIVGRCIPYVTHTQYTYKTEDKLLYRRKKQKQKKKKLINKKKERKKERKKKCRFAKIRNISYKHFYNLTNQFTLLTLLAKRLIKKTLYKFGIFQENLFVAKRFIY